MSFKLFSFYIATNNTPLFLSAYHYKMKKKTKKRQQNNKRKYSKSNKDHSR